MIHVRHPSSKYWYYLPVLNRNRVNRVGKIKCDVFVDRQLATCRKNIAGWPVCQLSFQVEVPFGAEEGILTFQIVVDGNVAEKADIDFGKD